MLLKIWTLVSVMTLLSGCVVGTTEGISYRYKDPALQPSTSDSDGSTSDTGSTSGGSSGGVIIPPPVLNIASDPLSIPESSDTRKIYVSNSQGSDSNDGLSEQRPVKSVSKGKSLLRHGMPDHLYLKRGDVWREGLGFWKIGGRDPSEPMVIAGYGNSPHRPKLETGDKSCFNNHAGGSSPYYVENLLFTGIHCVAHTRRPGVSGFNTNGSSGVFWLSGTRHLVIDDCMFELYRVGLVIQNFTGRGIAGVVLTRNVIIDSYSTSSHSQGMYISGVSDIRIEENVLDNNGFNHQVSDAKPTIFNHNVYIQSDARGLIFRRNVVSRASSHGIQARPGGIVSDNFFFSNPINLLMGGGDSPVPGGVEGTINNNVILNATDIREDSLPRGFGINLENIKTVTVSNNVMAHVMAHPVNRYAMDDDPNVNYVNNIVWNWPSKRNTHFNSVGPFVDSERSVESYQQRLGDEITRNKFFERIRAQSRHAYNNHYRAEIINQYFWAGFASP